MNIIDIQMLIIWFLFVANSFWGALKHETTHQWTCRLIVLTRKKNSLLKKNSNEFIQLSNHVQIEVTIFLGVLNPRVKQAYFFLFVLDCFKYISISHAACCKVAVRANIKNHKSLCCCLKTDFFSIKTDHLE